MKRIMLCLVLIACVLSLSSCGSNEFKYDNAIGWNSQKKDVLNKYGEPAGTFENDAGNENVRYENVNCCGHNGFYLFFEFDKQTGKVIAITLTNANYKYLDNYETDYEDIIKALTNKYGNPIDDGKDDQTIGFASFDKVQKTWNLEKENTYIKCSCEKSRQLNYAEIRIEYESKKSVNSNGI